RALVPVEHGEVQAVGALHVAQLPAGDVANAGPLNLDAVSAHVTKQLRAGRARLDVGEIEDAHPIERLAGPSPRLGRWRRQLGNCHFPLPLFFAKRALRIEIADAAALAAGRWVDHRVDEGRLAGVHCLAHGALELVWRRHIDAYAAERFYHPI